LRKSQKIGEIAEDWRNRRRLAKIAENFDLNTDPRRELGIFLVFRLFSLHAFQLNGSIRSLASKSSGRLQEVLQHPDTDSRFQMNELLAETEKLMVRHLAAVLF
jgi:hypothetical protein